MSRILGIFCFENARSTHKSHIEVSRPCWAGNTWSSSLISLRDNHRRVSNELSTILRDSSTDNFSVAGVFQSKLLYDALEARVVASDIFPGLARICIVGTKLNEQLVV